MPARGGIPASASPATRSCNFRQSRSGSSDGVYSMPGRPPRSGSGIHVSEPLSTPSSQRRGGRTRTENAVMPVFSSVPLYSEANNTVSPEGSSNSVSQTSDHLQNQASEQKKRRRRKSARSGLGKAQGIRPHIVWMEATRPVFHRASSIARAASLSKVSLVMFAPTPGNTRSVWGKRIAMSIPV